MDCRLRNVVCSDDLEAARQVIELANSGGMSAFYAGGLDNAVVVEGLTAILISVNKHYGTKTATVGLFGEDLPSGRPSNAG